MSLLGDPGKKSRFGAEIVNKTSSDEGRQTASSPRKTPSNAPDAGILIVQDDTVIKGKIHNCRKIEIFGYVEGELDAENVLVREKGRFFGTVKADNAAIEGEMQGKVFIKNLIDIRATGIVTGNVQYGQMAMENGATLSAEVRNVPPTLAGDFNLAVEKGKSAAVTTWDITAFDPDDDAKDLTYTVSRPVNGFIALKDAPAKPLDRFTQADIEGGKIVFQHDGKDNKKASFDVSVTDAKGGSSGEPQTVTVDVKAK